MSGALLTARAALTGAQPGLPFAVWVGQAVEVIAEYRDGAGVLTDPAAPRVVWRREGDSQPYQAAGADLTRLGTGRFRTVMTPLVAGTWFVRADAANAAARAADEARVAVRASQAMPAPPLGTPLLLPGGIPAATLDAQAALVTSLPVLPADTPATVVAVRTDTGTAAQADLVTLAATSAAMLLAQERADRMAGDAARLARASNLSDLASVPAARAALGLGAAALMAVGTAAGTVAAGDDARFLFTAAGAGGLQRGVGAKLAEMWAGAADYASTDALLVAAADRVVDPHALRTTFRGPDGTPQLEVDWTPEATEFFRVVGGRPGNGPTLVAMGAAANVSATLAAKGTGGFAFGNAGGLLLELRDDGTGNIHANRLLIQPGDTGVYPVLGSTTGLAYQATAQQWHDFRVRNAVQLRVRATFDTDTSDRWWEMGSDGTSGFARLETKGSAATVSGFLRAQGDGGWNFWNGRGAILTLAGRSADVPLVNSVVIQAAGTGVPARISASGEADAGLLLEAPGALTLASGAQQAATVGGATHLVIGPAGAAPASTDRWWELSSDGTTGVARMEVKGGAASAGAFLRALGDGSWAFWNGRGAMVTLGARQPGVPLVNNILIQASTTGQAARIAVQGEANATFRVEAPGALNLASGLRQTVTLLGQTHLAIGTTGAPPASTDRWWELSSDGTSGFARIEVRGTDAGATIGGFLRAQGDGGWNFWNGRGAILTLAGRSADVPAANSVLIQAAATGQAARIAATGEADAGLLLEAPGALTLASGSQQTVTVGGATHLVIGQSSGLPASTDRWLQIDSEGTSGQVRIQAAGTAATASLFLRALGEGNLNVWNGRGAMFTVAPWGINVPLVNSLVARPGGAGVQPVLGSVGEATCGLRLLPGGTGDLTLEGAVTRVTQALAVPVQVAVPVSGGTVTIGAGTHTLALIAGAGTAGLTINLPSAPASGQRLEITTNAGITGVTIVPGAGHSIDGSVTSLAAAAPPAWVFVGGANNRWMRV